MLSTPIGAASYPSFNELRTLRRRSGGAASLRITGLRSLSAGRGGGVLNGQRGPVVFDHICRYRLARMDRQSPLTSGCGAHTKIFGGAR